MSEIQLDTKGNAMYDEEYSILRVLMRRDGMSRVDAQDLIEKAREEVEEGGDPEEVCEEWCGLEPDYVMDLLAGMK